VVFIIQSIAKRERVDESRYPCLTLSLPGMSVAQFFSGKQTLGENYFEKGIQVISFLCCDARVLLLLEIVIYVKTSH